MGGTKDGGSGRDRGQAQGNERELAEYARVNDLGSAETQEINDKLQAIQEQVTELDNKTRVFWMDCQ